MISETQNASGLSHVLYRSVAQQDVTHDDLKVILESAHQRNSVLDLTGCLHYEDGLFFQWLEGPRHAVDHVMEMIQADQRHREIVQLSNGPLSQRLFGDWTMRSTYGNKRSLMDWFAAYAVSTFDRVAYAGGVRDFLVEIA